MKVIQKYSSNLRLILKISLVVKFLICNVELHVKITRCHQFCTAFKDTLLISVTYRQQIAAETSFHANGKSSFRKNGQKLVSSYHRKWNTEKSPKIFNNRFQTHIPDQHRSSFHWYISWFPLLFPPHTNENVLIKST